MATDSGTQELQLLNAIRDGIDGTREVVAEISERLLDSAGRLRVEQSESTFSRLSQDIENLSHLMEFIQELKRGIEQLKNIGSRVDVSMGSMSCWDRLLDVLKEMLQTFEHQDWIMLADLIQYELHPLLSDGEKNLSELSKGFSANEEALEK